MGRLLALTVAIVVWTACSSPGSARDEAAPTTASTTLPATGPGTELADGLEVPPGAHLIGRVFPSMRYPDETGTGWRALLAVDDGPAAYEALVGQAEAAGFTPGFSTPCQTWVEEDVERTECVGSFEQGSRQISIGVGVGACGPVGESHMTLSGKDAAARSPSSAESHTLEQPPPTAAVPPTTVRTDGGPRPGELLNPRDGHPIAPVTLELGTRLVGPSSVSCHFSGGHTSVLVLVLDATVDEVIDRYARQWMTVDRPKQATVRTQEVGDLRLTSLSTDIGGGDMWNLTVAEEAGEPTFAVVSTGTDP